MSSDSDSDDITELMKKELLKTQTLSHLLVKLARKFVNWDMCISKGRIYIRTPTQLDYNIKINLDANVGQNEEDVYIIETNGRRTSDFYSLCLDLMDLASRK